MKRFPIIFIMLFTAFASVEAKNIELILNQINNEYISGHGQCREIKIENIGNQVVRKCLPFINNSPALTIETLAEKLAKEEHPLLALLELWSSVEQIDDCFSPHCHPLDLINFIGVCPKEEYAAQFIRLCHALGIETRRANIQGKLRYDFCLDEEWNYLDVENHRLYLGLDNETLASSEGVMDDPFIALRVKHGQSSLSIDFAESWKELAHFEIVSPKPAETDSPDSPILPVRPIDFDLFPGEYIRYKNLETAPCIERKIDLKERNISLSWSAESPYPIKQIVNNSNTTIILPGKNLIIEQGQESPLFEEEIFSIELHFLVQPKGDVLLISNCAKGVCPRLTAEKNLLSLGMKANPGTVKISYDYDEASSPDAPKILSHIPTFQVEASDKIEQIRWQISRDREFLLVPSNLDSIEEMKKEIELPLISQTFLNPGETYYIRVRGSSGGVWSHWSEPYPFSVKKPSQVENVIFEEIDSNSYQLNWERFAGKERKGVEYFVFGSNSIDFIPSLYCSRQVNSIVNGIAAEEKDDNLIAITTKPKLKVKGDLAYYRIIARENGQFSVPSKLIHVYDDDFIQPRNALQIVEEGGAYVAKRILFPPAYPWSVAPLPSISDHKRDNMIAKLQLVMRSASSMDKRYRYEYPTVDESVWEEVRPYLLPENHPAWAKLNRVFCKTRATKNTETFKKAGFKRWRPGKWSRVSASTHYEFKEYFIKAYTDMELGILYDWKKWIHRIKGAETIRQCIKDYNMQSHFKVPHKWIYPLPKNPSPPNSSHYLRKNFILVVENMMIEEHENNEKLYKKMDRRTMKGLYIILQVCGLYDSVYCFNMPFCKDGKIAIIDTEYHHKWPVPFFKLRRSFSSDNRDYWDRMTFKGGKIPDGENQYNPPRMDRRDHPENKK